MRTNLHASCVALAGAGAVFDAPQDAGVLLLGPSGAGKSDLALRLIAAGAVLVADDRTDLSIQDGALVAAPPSGLAGLIEVRNLGIVALPHRRSARIALVVDLTAGEPPARLPQAALWLPPPALDLAENARPPLIRLDPFAISTPAKIAIAAAAFAHSLFREAAAPI